MPLLERHVQAPPKEQENTVQPYSRVLGSCRSFLSAYKHAEQRVQGIEAVRGEGLAMWSAIVVQKLCITCCRLMLDADTAFLSVAHLVPF